MTTEGVTSRRIFHIYLSDAARLACDTPETEVEVVIAERAWQVIETARLCMECVRIVESRRCSGTVVAPLHGSVDGHSIESC